MPGTQAIGVISDTHGLLRPEAIDALRGSDLIVHAGDIGGPDILKALRELAPVVAVRGNNDREGWARDLNDTEVVRAGDILLYVLHNLHQLDIDPSAAGFKAVISGHSHQPKVEKRVGVLFLNPGSAGPRRFRRPIAVARLRIDGNFVSARIIELAIKRRPG